MKNYTIKLLLYSLTFLLFISCEKNENSEDVLAPKNTRIKYIKYDGKIISNHVYNEFDKISEIEGLGFYQVFEYENNGKGKLVKYSYYSNSNNPNNYIFNTANNSKINFYRKYFYKNDGKIDYTESYQLKNNKFEFLARNSFDYHNDKIVRFNFLSKDFKSVSGYYQYFYDNEGNLVNQKNYFKQHLPVLSLSNDIYYKYDEFKNPFQFYEIIGFPELSNPNNIIEQNFTNPQEKPPLHSIITYYNYEYDENNTPKSVIIKEPNLGSQSKKEYVYEEIEEK